MADWPGNFNGRGASWNRRGALWENVRYIKATILVVRVFESGLWDPGFGVKWYVASGGEDHGNSIFRKGKETRGVFIGWRALEILSEMEMLGVSEFNCVFFFYLCMWNFFELT